VPDVDLVRLRTALVEEVVRMRSRGVIVDVTAIDVMDSFASRTLQELAQMIRLRGAETVIVGIQPDVASRWCSSDCGWRTSPLLSTWKKGWPT